MPLGERIYDAAVAVESLHHFTADEKISLYTRLHTALKDDGYFILTDYFAPSDEEERMHRAELLKMKKEAGIADNEIYHYDTPLTVEHEMEALKRAGFTYVEVMKSWGATSTLKARR